MFLGKGVRKTCSKFTRENPWQSVISINLQSNIIEIPHRHECSPVNVLHIFITPFLKNTSGWLLLIFLITLSKIVQVDSEWLGFIYEFLVPSSTQVDHVHYFDQCSVLLSLLWLLHSMFYEVFLCPRIHLFLSGCICLSICHIFLHIQTILDDSTSALTPKVQDSITHTFLTGSHFLQFLSLASSLTLLVGYAKGVALLLFAEANIR